MFQLRRGGRHYCLHPSLSQARAIVTESVQARFWHPWSRWISATERNHLYLWFSGERSLQTQWKHVWDDVTVSSDPPPLKPPDLPSLESDWLICPGPRRRGLGCSPGLSCAFVDWWRRLFLLETRSERFSTVVVLDDTQLYCIRQEELTLTCVTRLATDFCKRSVRERKCVVFILHKEQWDNNSHRVMCSGSFLHDLSLCLHSFITA